MILIAIALLVADVLLWIAYKKEKAKRETADKWCEAYRKEREEKKPKAMTAPIVKKEPAPLVFHYGKKQNTKTNKPKQKTMKRKK